MNKKDKFNFLFNKFELYRKDLKLRKTPEREMLIKEICENLIEIQPHFEADELFTSLMIKKEKISRATIFRNLKLFVEAGILRKTSLGEKHSHYEVVFKTICQHDHLICEKCGKIIEFDNCDIVEKVNEITEENDFELTNFKFEIYGICKDCRDKK